MIQCPDCNKTFENVRSLGPHRRMAHGYSVKDGKNDPKRLAEERKIRKRPKGKFPFPHCTFVASWQGGLKNHIRAKHAERAEIAKVAQNAPIQISHSSNGHAKAADDGINHRLEAAATFAAGRVTQLLESIAFQHELPTKPLAALVLKVIHATSLR
jgi:uncharacterized C2H2 Zn-finger protein